MKKVSRIKARWLSNKRWGSELRRRKIYAYLKRKKFSNRPRRIAVFNNKLRELEFLSQMAQPLGLKEIKTQRSLSVKVPKEFSIFSKPDGVLKLIHLMSQYHKAKHLQQININHADCQQHDLAAEVLLAMVVSGLNAVRRKSGNEIGINGSLSKSQRINRLIRSVGVAREIAEDKYVLKKNLEEHDLHAFRCDSLRLENKTPGQLDQKTRATQSLTKHLNIVLKQADSQTELAVDAKKIVERYVGELIDNSEEHSGQSIWHAYGYLDTRNNSTHKAKKSELLVVSIGNSIFSTFDKKRDSNDIWERISPYVARHRSLVPEHILVTIKAMQNLVSSKRDHNKSRGRGTRDLIVLFKKISKYWETDFNEQSNTTPEMIILSGNCVLRITPEMVRSIDEKNPELAFNKGNDYNRAPETRYAYETKYEFPGVLVSIKFPFGPSLLEVINDG